MAFPDTTFTNGLTATTSLKNKVATLGMTSAVLDEPAFLAAFLANWIDDLKTSGPVRSISGTAASGYATGAGGAVTQITNAATGVTLSKPCGQITTVALTTAAAAEEEFIVTNTLVAATDVIATSTTYAGAGTPIVSVKGVGAGAFSIVITNVHAANALNAVLVINFAVIKAVAA